MYLDFRTHRRKKYFPFSLFGFIGLIIAVVTPIYMIAENVSLIDLLNRTANSNNLNVFYYALIISAFLLMVFSFGIIREIKSSIKYLVGISLIIYFASLMLMGYFYDSAAIYEDILRNHFYAGAIFFLLLFISFIVQKNQKSFYNSKIIQIITSLPLVPYVIISIAVFNNSYYAIGTNDLSYLSIVKYVLIGFMALYILINTIYLIVINHHK